MLRRRAKLADLANWIFCRLEKAKLLLSAFFCHVLGKREWQSGSWGVTEVPDLPEWMQPHCVPAKLCIVPTSSPWKGHGKGQHQAIQQGPAGDQNYTQPALRFFKLLPKPWHWAPSRNLALILIDEGRSHQFECLWGLRRQPKGVKRPR